MLFLHPVATSDVCRRVRSDDLTFWLVRWFLFFVSVPVPPAFWGQLLTCFCYNMKVYSKVA